MQILEYILDGTHPSIHLSLRLHREYDRTAHDLRDNSVLLCLYIYISYLSKLSLKHDRLQVEFSNFAHLHSIDGWERLTCSPFYLHQHVMHLQGMHLLCLYFASIGPCLVERDIRGNILKLTVRTSISHLDMLISLEFLSLFHRYSHFLS